VVIPPPVSGLTPAIPWLSDSNPVTVGVKFRSDVSGSVTGIRFYKGAGNNGTHIGLLYSSTGSLLSQATFTAESASGWQQVSFSLPVNISANTTYIAAYFTNSGFAYGSQFFTSTGVDIAPLHFLRSGVDGPNGVYMYGGAPQFPSQSYADANYGVDVVFSTGSTSPQPSGSSAWSSSVVPGTPWRPEPNPVTLGVRFRSDISGSVTAFASTKARGTTVRTRACSTRTAAPCSHRPLSPAKRPLGGSRSLSLRP